MNQLEIIKNLEMAFHKVAPEIDFKAINVEKALRGQIEIDSYDFYQLLVLLEKATEVKIPEGALKEMKSLSDLVQYIQDKSM
jgi:acyl carrier protein